MHRALPAVAAGLLVLVWVPSAQAGPPVLRQVVYTVTTEQPVTADIYYRVIDPPTWADYSRNPYLYSPKAHVGIGPDKPWVRTVTLADPDRWAMVSATSGRIRQRRSSGAS